MKSHIYEAQKILDTTTESIIVVDSHFCVKQVNRSGLELLGVDRNYAIDSQFDEIIEIYREKDRLFGHEHPLYSTLHSGEVKTFMMKDRLIAKNRSGRSFYVSMGVAPLYENELIAGAVVSIRDISVTAKINVNIQKKAQKISQEFIDEHSRLQASIQSMSLGFIITNKSHQVIQMNGAAKNILECTHLSGLQADDITPSIDQVEDRLKSINLHNYLTRAYREKKPFDIAEVEFRSKILHIIISPVVVMRGDGMNKLNIIGLVILIEDITERKLLERSKDEFFSIASHELRTPLTAIRGNSAILIDYFKDNMSDARILDIVSDIHTSSIRLIEIVNEFLHMSRLEQRRLEFQYTTFDLIGLMSECMRELKPIADGKGVGQELVTGENKELIITADRDRLKEVFINLLGNGLKFTDKGKISLLVGLQQNNVIVRVCDTGRGISPKNQRLLFRKFQQASNNILTRETSQGTGLGLYISRLLIEGMNGKIELEYSLLGKGSIFRLSIPKDKRVIT